MIKGNSPQSFIIDEYSQAIAFDIRPEREKIEAIAVSTEFCATKGIERRKDEMLGPTRSQAITPQ